MQYETRGGIAITKTSFAAPFETANRDLVAKLNHRKGVYLASNYEYPGRYNRWEFGFVDPPVMVEASGRAMKISALNGRGEILVGFIEAALETCDDLAALSRDGTVLSLTVKTPDRVFNEEERSRAPSVFSVLRVISDLFQSDADESLGLYGAMGYDLAFQFEPIEFHLERPDDQRDLVMFIPDRVLIVDNYGQEATEVHYEFARDGLSTDGQTGGGDDAPFVFGPQDVPMGDHVPGEYAKMVVKAKDSFKRGDLFEVVPGQVFYEACKDQPADIFQRLTKINPAPFGFIMNLGDQEYLVGASPEMFVRVTGRRVETCPISGTIARGKDAIEDSKQVLTLLQSEKDESELTMCTDVDRNDKSRVCVPGSVRVIGRRQIEMYSRLIHTVDHIEGQLRPEMDAMDAFLSHAWAVTVTGAPKLWAMRFIEEHEKSTRAWYGGAVGAMLFNGDMNTGLTLRTIRIKDGVAQVRAGATLLFDSDPEAEEAETELKASAMRAAIRGDMRSNTGIEATVPRLGEGRRVLLVDHEDSFVHTLANYVRQTGAEVLTTRTPLASEVLDEFRPDLVLMSPGPGSPQDFDCSATIQMALDRDLPIFGVCLGMQAIACHFGGSLNQLDTPVHGKPSRISISEPGVVFDGLPDDVAIGRYHSLYAKVDDLPEELQITAMTEDGIPMALEHRTLPIAAVQFHPESVMSLGQNAGLQMILNVVANLGTQRKPGA